MLEYLVNVRELGEWIPHLPRIIYIKRYQYFIDKEDPCTVVRRRPKCTRRFSFPVSVCGIVPDPSSRNTAFVILSNRDVHMIYNEHNGVHQQLTSLRTVFRRGRLRLFFEPSLCEKNRISNGSSFL